jgi:hypothetical protein
MDRDEIERYLLKIFTWHEIEAQFFSPNYLRESKWNGSC